jgi:hypothetical protein
LQPFLLFFSHHQISQKYIYTYIILLLAITKFQEKNCSLFRFF